MKKSNSWKGWTIAAVWIATAATAPWLGFFTFFVAILAYGATESIAGAE